MLRRDDRLGYLWLAIGAVLSLFAVHGRWDIPIAAWLSCVFLLRFVRTSPVLLGLVGAWVVGAVSAAFWLYESGLEVVDPTLLLCLSLSTVLVTPYLVYRLVAPRLAVISPLLATFVFPLARVCCEYLNALFSPAGNIFGSLAATQHGNLPLLQIAAITGSYGVSFLIAWFAAAANTVWERAATQAQSRTVVVAFIAVLIAVHAGGGIRLAFFPPSASTVRVAGVSPSMAAVAHRDEILRRYSSFDELANAEPAVLRPALATVNDDLLAASEREAVAGAKIIVWPEAGAGTLAEDHAGLMARAARSPSATTSTCTSGSVCSAAGRPTCGTRPSLSILRDRWSGPTTRRAQSRVWTSSPQATEQCRPSTHRTASWLTSSASTLTSQGSRARAGARA